MIKHFPKYTPWALLLFIILIGTLLRLYDLGAESYWVDEITMAKVAGGNLDSILTESIKSTRPPAYVILAHMWMYLFGSSEVATRSLSAVFGIASIIAIFAVANQLFERRVGLISALIMSISYFQIYHSQEFRYYSLFTFLTLVSFYFFIHLIKYRTLKSTIAYSIFTALLFYTHTFGIFVIFAQIFYLILQPKTLRIIFTRWLVSQLIVLLLISPGLFIATSRALEKGGGESSIYDPSISMPFITLIIFITEPMSFIKYWHFALIPLIAYAIALIIYIIMKSRKYLFTRLVKFSTGFKEYKEKSTHILLVSCWLIIPILLPFALSYLVGPMFLPRYTIAASPAFFILIALGLVTIREILPEYVILASIVIIVTPGLYSYYKTDVKEDWRETALYIEKESKQTDTIIFVDYQRDWSRKSFYWYYRGNLPGCSMDVSYDYNEIKTAFDKCILNKDRFWLVIRNYPSTIDISPFYKFFLYGDNKDFRQLSNTNHKYIWTILFKLNK